MPPGRSRCGARCRRSITTSTKSTASPRTCDESFGSAALDRYPASARINARHDVLERTDLLHIVPQPGAAHRLRKQETMQQRIDDAADWRRRADGQRRKVTGAAFDRCEIMIEAS